MRIKYFIFATTKFSVLTLLLRDKCNICVWGGTAKGHRADYELLIRSHTTHNIVVLTSSCLKGLRTGVADT